MRLEITLPVLPGPADRYTPTAARALLRKPMTLVVDGRCVLAIVVFAEVVDDGSGLVVTLDYDPPDQRRNRRRSQVTTARSRQNGPVVTSQVTPKSQPRSQPGSQPLPEGI